LLKYIIYGTSCVKVEDASVPFDHDLLTGGFPCQSFSTMGPQDGFGDARGLLFLEVECAP
jgi:DNA (cytosine-5)-methyltransferase 1